MRKYYNRTWNARLYTFIVCCLLLLNQLVIAHNVTDSLLTIVKNTENKPDQQSQAYIDLAWKLLYLSSDSSLFFGEKALSIALEHQQYIHIAEAYNIIGAAKTIQSKFDTSLVIFQLGLNSINIALPKLKDSTEINLIKKRIAGILANMSNCYYNKSNYTQSIHYYQLTAKAAIESKTKWLESVAYTGIATCYQELKKYDLSLQYHKMSLQLAIKSSDSLNTAESFLSIGKAYMLMSEKGKSKEYFLKAIEIYENLGEDYFLKFAYLDLCHSYLKLDKLDSALIFLEKSRSLTQKYPELQAEIYYHNLYGNYLLLVGDYKGAKEHYIISYQLSEKYGWDKYMEDASFKLVNIFEELKQYDSAFKYLVINRAISDSIFSKESDKRIAELEVKYQVDRKELSIKNLEEQKAKDEQLRILLLVLLVVIIVSSSIVITSYILRRNKTRQLYEAEKKLLDTELEKNKVEQQQLTEDIEHRTKQLTTHALNMMQKNKLLQEINRNIADIVENPENLDESFRKLKRQIIQSVKADNDWQVFKMYFEQINSSFFNKLHEINSNLTAHDLRLCALIKLNLNIKETAAVLNLSPNSIKSARYKLRKRLDLRTEVDLSEYIQKIGES